MYYDVFMYIVMLCHLYVPHHCTLLTTCNFTSTYNYNKEPSYTENVYIIKGYIEI